jgi:hypothetical protein
LTPSSHFNPQGIDAHVRDRGRRVQEPSVRLPSPFQEEVEVADHAFNFA